MTDDKLLVARMRNQLLAGRREGITTPPQVVAHLGAMQAQEYGMAKWAVGLRLPNSTDADVEAAFQRGEILRTHVLRPTWHFVHPDDIRWLLKLTAPRVHAKNAYMYKKTALDAETLRRSCRIIEQELGSGTEPLTRPELQERLAAAGIEAHNHRLSYIMMHAELEGLICSGPRRGKQFTYALLDAVAPGARADYTQEEMLALLARRYFASRAPATVRDLAYWSGLTVKDAQLGANSLAPEFVAEKAKGEVYIRVENTAVSRGHGAEPDDCGADANANAAFLMPDYDEYVMSYRQRVELNVYPGEVSKQSEYSHWLIVRGAIAGTWQPSGEGGAPEVRLFPAAAATGGESEAIARASQRYARFRTE